MRFFHVLLMTLAALLPLGAASAQQGAFGGGVPNVPAELVAESVAPAPGTSVDIAFVMRPKPGWHGYWENPGDAGLGMTVKWTLPGGVATGSLRYPVPERLLIAGLMNYVYEGPYAVLTTLKIPAAMKAGDRLPVRVRADWLACTRQVCVPEGGDLSLDLIVGDGGVTPAARAAFDGYRARLPRPLGAEAHYAVANGKVRIGIAFPAGATATDAYFYPLTDGLLKYAAPQTVTREGDLLVVEADAAKPGQGEATGVLAVGPHQGLLVTAKPGAVPSSGGGGVALILLALGGALLGGLLLNIMPCVFPILSLKALSLAKAGLDARAARREALAYAAGVILTCMALGGALLALRASGAAVGWAFQLQDPRVILLLLALVSAIALNLAGLFELPTFGGGVATGKGGAAGAFWTGALVAFVATPCTGPFMGAALGAALVLPIAAALAIFAGLGIGLALPFVLIAYIPALRARMPRPGAWMATFRHILSVPMFLTALALAWLLGRQVGVTGMALGLAVALLVGLFLWWLGARQRGGKAGGVVLGLAMLGVLLAGAILLPRDAPRMAAAPEASEPFSEARLATLRARNKPVFLYFTADWCLTCKANEAAAIDRSEVADAFRKAGVVTMVGDWTNSDPAIGRFLNDHGRSGVPLYLWYAPGKDAQELPQLLTPGTLTALAH